MNGGSDESASPSYSATNGGWNSATGVFTPTSGNPSLSVTVGQFASVFLDGATTPVFVGRVTAVSSTTVTVSTTAKSGTAPTTAGTGISVNVGGVLKGPNAADKFPFQFITSAQTDSSSNPPRVNLKGNAAYAVTAGITHSLAGRVAFQGYSATPGDGGKATINGPATGASIVVLDVSGNDVVLKDLIVSNNGDSGSAFNVVTVSGARSYLQGVVACNSRGYGIQSSGSNSQIIECETYACGVAGLRVDGSGTIVKNCISHDMAVDAFINGIGGVQWINCIADTVTGTAIGFNFTAGGSSGIVDGCVARNCAGSGLSVSGATSRVTVRNSLFVSNGGYGIAASSTANGHGVVVQNCAFYNNTSGQTNNVNTSLITGSITLTGDPFTDAANGDFDLNNTAGAGADCRGAGRGTFTQTAASYTGTLGYPDIGAAQHQDSGGGGTSGARLVGPSALVTPGGFV
jgi:hypothetical protein